MELIFEFLINRNCRKKIRPGNNPDTVQWNIRAYAVAVYRYPFPASGRYSIAVHSWLRITPLVGTVVKTQHQEN